MDPRLGAVTFMAVILIAGSVVAILAIRAGALTSLALLAVILGAAWYYNR